MSLEIFKKTPSEKLQAKKAKREWVKDLKKLDSTISKKRGLFGFKTKDFTQIRNIISLSEKARVAMLG